METIKTATESHLAQRDKLLRVLGVGFGLAIVVGGTIGVSIFRLPGSIAALLGSAWLMIFVWLLGGIYTLLSANYTAELATMLPKAGGPYVMPVVRLEIMRVSLSVGAVGLAIQPRSPLCPSLSVNLPPHFSLRIFRGASRFLRFRFCFCSLL